MFLSQSKKFIFIHITKAAGTSLTYALEESMAWNDLVIGSTELGAQLQRFYLPRFKLQKHSKAIEIRDVIGPELWEEYFTFSFVRHPYSRALSLYRYIEGQVLGKGWKRYLRNLPWTRIARDPIWNWPATRAYLETETFSEFIRHPILVWEPGMKPQVEWLQDEDGALMVDFIGKVESIGEDFRKVQKQLGLEPSELGVYNRSSRQNQWENIISEEDYAYLEELYRDDFQLLGYNPDMRIGKNR